MKQVSKKLLFSFFNHGYANCIVTREKAVVVDCKLEVTGPETSPVKNVYIFILEDLNEKVQNREFKIYRTDEPIPEFDSGRRYWHIATMADKGAFGYGDYRYDAYYSVWELK